MSTPPWTTVAGIEKIGAVTPDAADELAYQWVKSGRWKLKDFIAWLAFRTEKRTP